MEFASATFSRFLLHCAAKGVTFVTLSENLRIIVTLSENLRIKYEII